MAGQISCTWMALKAQWENNGGWEKRRLALPTWNVINEEVRAKRQGRHSVSRGRGQPGGGQQGVALMGAMQVAMSGMTPMGHPTRLTQPLGSCLKCGQMGHWAVCPLKGPKGRMQMVGT